MTKSFFLQNGIKINLTSQNFEAGSRQYSVYRIQELDNLVDQIDDEEFNKDERLPYWAELWPSAAGLSRYIAENPFLVSGKTVLELGCGLGFTSMVISSQKPAEFLITDYEQDALELTKMNFAQNSLSEPEVMMLDWREPNLEKKYEVIIAADILYEERFFRPLLSLFLSSLSPGGSIILAEPCRSIAAGFFALLENSGFVYKRDSFDILHDSLEIKVNMYQIRMK